MTFADKIRLMIPSVVNETIDGQDFSFYQCSPFTLSNSAQLVARLAGNVSVLLADRDADVGHTIQDFQDPATGETGQTTVINPASEGLISARTDRRRSAIEDLVMSVLESENRHMLIGLIVSSLKKEFNRNVEAEQADGIKQFDDMDLGPFVKFFLGMMKANAKVFGDLGKQLTDRVQEAMKGDAAEPAEPEEEPVPLDSVG